MKITIEVDSGDNLNVEMRHDIERHLDKILQNWGKLKIGSSIYLDKWEYSYYQVANLK